MYNLLYLSPVLIFLKHHLYIITLKLKRKVLGGDENIKVDNILIISF